MQNDTSPFLVNVVSYPNALAILALIANGKRHYPGCAISGLLAEESL